MFKYAISLTLFSYVSADWSQIVSDVDQIFHNTSYLIQIAMEMATDRSSVQPAVDRALTQSDMGQLSRYGCWCYFEDDFGKGRGQPIDEVDAQCKVLQDGYFCAVHDHMDPDSLISSCEPWSITYNSAIGIGLGSISIPNVIQECDDANVNTCGSAACKIEGWFVIGFMRQILTGAAINQDYRHENGFDKDAMCPISGSGLKSEKTCCGEHPTRFPFKSYGGNRECCQGHTFNTNLYTCCADGRVKISC